MKKWNWEIFFMIVLICAIGACGNKNAKSMFDVAMLVCCVGIPFGLLWAWLGKHE